MYVYVCNNAYTCIMFPLRALCNTDISHMVQSGWEITTCPMPKLSVYAGSTQYVLIKTAPAMLSGLFSSIASPY